MSDLLRTYFDLVGVTSTFGVLMSAVVSDNIREKSRRVMFSDDDLEASSYDATEAIIDGLTHSDRGGFSILRIIFFYATVNAAIFVVFRLWHPDLPFKMPDDQHWTLIILASVLGLAWFVSSLFASQFLLGRLKSVPDQFQLTVAVLDVVLTHAIILAFIFIAMLLNIGVDQLFVANVDGFFAKAWAYSLSIFTLDRGVDLVVVSQYVAAFIVTVILWFQMVVASISRLLTRADQTQENIAAPKKQGFTLPGGQWINPKADPFMVGTLILIAIESVVFFLIFGYTYIA